VASQSANLSVEPVARKRQRLALMSAVVTSKTADFICEAMKRFQIRL
jgi:hypothetical protein